MQESMLDFFLFGLLYYKIVALVLSTMPVQWIFGIKIPLLRYCAKSSLVKIYMLLAPLVGLGIAVYLTHVYRSRKAELQSGAEVIKETDLEDLEMWSIRCTISWFNTLLIFVVRWLYELIRGDPEPLFQVEKEALKREMINFKPLPLPLLKSFTAVQRYFTPPRITGYENLPADRNKIMFVGNHCVWALDSLMLFIEIYANTGIYIRGLAEHFWFVLPLANEVMSALGGIDGTRENCDILMTQGQSLFVYPGGVREAWKKKDEKKYDLIWGNHVGFAKMAIKHGYTLVPISSVGTEDMFSIITHVPVGWLMRAGKEGMGGKSLNAPLILPPSLGNCQRVYFHIGKPIETSHLNGNFEDPETVANIRDQCQDSLRKGIAQLLVERESDPDRYTFPSLNELRKRKLH
jgi:1-acyl-sn-glycerol-3-phosphate acyltransferase